MTCRTDLRSDAARCPGTVLDPQVHQYVCNVLEEFSHCELKEMLFLLMTDLYDKKSINNYLQLVMGDEDLRFQFHKKWHEGKFTPHDLIELLGTMKKFKHIKNLGMCKHTFKKKQSAYKTIPDICKFFYSVCEELDDDEIRTLQNELFPMVSKDVCGEELICLMLLHEKFDCSDFGLLKQSFCTLGRKDLISKIETYENQKQHIFPSNVYPIRQPTFQKPSGLAVIINENKFTESTRNVGERLSLEERKGSEIDCRKLQKLWWDFGFEVETHVDLTMNQIIQLLQQLGLRDLSPFDVFVMCIMSHGQKGVFYSSDSVKIDTDSFIADLADRCLFGKPKLIFVQACQGAKHNEGIPVYPEMCVQRKLAVDSRPQIETIPKLVDVFKAIATIDDHVSYRDEQSGSWFISHLVKNINEYGDKEDIKEILTRVTDDITKENAAFDGKLCKQVPISSSTLRRKVIFKRVQEIV